ncbi:MAG: choline dehydrogenase-like flavoprotein, partial [Myxococcota bacterium]
MAALERAHKQVREVEFEVFGEFLPNPQTYVATDPTVKDKWGIPVASIHLQNHPLDVRNSRKVAEAAVAILKAAGATATGIEAAGETTFVLQHGTARMGSDPASSVTDARGKVWGMDNVYVSDGSACMGRPHGRWLRRPVGHLSRANTVHIY